MKLFIALILSAIVIGGFVGAELMDSNFSLAGAVVGGVGTAAVMLGLGGFFDARGEKRNKQTLAPEMRAVFDRMLGKDISSSKQYAKPALSPQTQRPVAEVSSTKQENVGYFEKIDNLMAAKGARDDFTTLQGWDKEFGTASARVCAMAELTNESAVVVAAFMLESMEYYHKNRDIALSYLARLESGYQAKIEHPELAATLDVEVKTRNEAEELFKSFEADPDSSGAAYIQQVTDFMRSTGYYDNLVFPALRQSDFMRAFANACVAGYQTASSPKVLGALITDGAKKYKSDRQFGVVFLNKVATNLRERYGDVPTLGSETSRTTPPSAKPIAPTSSMRTYMPEEQRIEAEAVAYHLALDTIAKNSLTYMIDNGILTDERHHGVEQKHYAELILYLTTCNARNVTQTKIHPGTWNTFKRSIEVRMLGIRDDCHQRSGVIHTPDGGSAYAQFISTYWQRMDALEDVLNSRGKAGLIKHLLRDMGADTGKAERFIAYFNKQSDDAASSLLPRIAAFD